MKWSRAFSILFLAVVFPAVGEAEPNRSWDTLMQSARVGKKVVVIRMNAGQVEGKLLSITPEEIAVEQDSVREVIRREDVFRVRYANIRRRHTLIGLAIGAGAGIVLGAAAENDDDVYREVAAAGMGLFGAGIGSAIGAALPIGPPLYEAESVRRAGAR